DRLVEVALTGSGTYVLKRNDGLGGSAFMALARARGKLRRIAMNMSSPGQTLTLTGGSFSPLVAHVPAGKPRAIIYMDDGDYTVLSTGSTMTITVAADAELAIF